MLILHIFLAVICVLLFVIGGSAMQAGAMVEAGLTDTAPWILHLVNLTPSIAAACVTASFMIG